MANFGLQQGMTSMRSKTRRRQDFEIIIHGAVIKNKIYDRKMRQMGRYVTSKQVKILSFIYSPTDALVSCLRNIKIYIKQLRHISMLQLHHHHGAPNSATHIHQ